MLSGVSSFELLIEPKVNSRRSATSDHSKRSSLKEKKPSLIKDIQMFGQLMM